MESQQIKHSSTSSKTSSFYNRKYAKSLFKRIYRIARIASRQHNNNSKSKSKLTKINDILKQIDADFGDGRFPSGNDHTFYDKSHQLFDKFVEQKFIDPNTEFAKKYLVLIDKYFVDNKVSNREYPQQIAQKTTNNGHEGEGNEIDQRQPQKEMIPISPILSDGIRNKKPNQKILIMLDWDDTLIPSSIIKSKKFNVSEKNTNDKEKKELNIYVKELTKFMDKLLSIFNGNKDSSIKIVTNASSLWVSEGSFCRTGSLFAKVMRSFNEKMADAKISIISAHDHKNKNPAIFEDLKVRQYKRRLMEWIYCDYFGMRLEKRENKNQDIKIISIGDSSMEFKSSKIALECYLERQRKDVLINMNASLHRIKFTKKPTSFKKLGDELKYCSENIDEIVYKNHNSRDYYL